MGREDEDRCEEGEMTREIGRRSWRERERDSEGGMEKRDTKKEGNRDIGSEG